MGKKSKQAAKERILRLKFLRDLVITAGVLLEIVATIIKILTAIG